MYAFTKHILTGSYSYMYLRETDERREFVRSKVFLSFRIFLSYR